MDNNAEYYKEAINRLIDEGKAKLSSRLDLDLFGYFATIITIVRGMAQLG
jgi:hypothetical protein